MHELVDSAKQREKQLGLKGDKASQTWLRAAREGSAMAGLKRPLENAQADQETADDDNVRRLSIHDLTGSGNILVYHVASLLSASELTGALSACRAWHSMMPDAVRILDGVNPDTTDEMVIALLQRFTRATCIDLRGCKRLTDRSVTAIAELCPHLIQLILE